MIKTITITIDETVDGIADVDIKGATDTEGVGYEPFEVLIDIVGIADELRGMYGSKFEDDGGDDD